MSNKNKKKEVHYLKGDPRAKKSEIEPIVWYIPNILGGRKPTDHLRYLINHYYWKS